MSDSVLASVFNFFHDVFHPWDYIRDKLIDLYNGLGSLFDKWVIHPPGPLPGAWQTDLYGNALGLAGGLAAATFIVLMVVSMFWQRKLVSTGKSLVIAVLIGTLGPLFYAGSDWLVAAGSDLTSSVAHIGSLDSQKLLLLPDIHNVFGAIFGTLILAVLGGLLVLIFLMYQLAIILATFFALPMIALYPIGRVPQTAMRWVVSMGLMAALVGRPVAALELKATSLVIQDVSGTTQSSFVAVALLTAALLLAIATQVGLIWLAHKSYAGIEGVIRGVTDVRGRVEMTSKDNLKVELDRVSDRFAGKAAAVAALAGPEVAAAYAAGHHARLPNVSSSTSVSTWPQRSGSKASGEGGE